MTPEPRLVYLPGSGALLPDGTFIAEAYVRRAAEAIARLCDAIEALPPDARVVLEAMAAVQAGEQEPDG